MNQGRARVIRSKEGEEEDCRSWDDSGSDKNSEKNRTGIRARRAGDREQGQGQEQAQEGHSARPSD